MHTTMTGHTLYDRQGDEIGEIVDVVGGDPVAEPDQCWLAVRTGWFATRLVPSADVHSRGEFYVSDHPRDEVRHAPKVDPHIEPVGVDMERLHDHYGTPDPAPHRSSMR